MAKAVGFASLAVSVGAADVFLSRSLLQDCPGGSLSACIDLCPADPTAFVSCVTDCQAQCGDSPTPTPSPSPSPTPPPSPPAPPSPAPTPSEIGDCHFYAKDTSNCDNNCGNCFNAGARPGVKCKGDSTGYYCNSDSPGAGADMTFACLDWTFGSSAMKSAESTFKQRTGEDVFFGVGTFGTGDDPQRGLGSCFRIQAEGVGKDLLVQSINTGSDVSGFQFDLMIGDGGAGAYNTCAGGGSPGVDTMFPGEYSMDTWGHQYGGVDDRELCTNLPHYAAVDGPMKAAGDDLVHLCEYGFDKGVRQSNGGNPNILTIGRVQCPEELVEFTQIQRNDEPSGYACGTGCATATHACQASQPGASLEWCLTRMMDCRKPSGAFKDNIQPSLMVEGKKLVQTCTSDGYTRIDVQCGCNDCYC